MTTPKSKVGWLLALVFTLACASQKDELRLTGDPYQARKRLAGELLARRELDGALAYIEQLRGERPDDLDTRVLRGVVLREKGMLDQAQVDLEAVLKQDPKRADAHEALAVLLDQRHEGQSALTHHRAALKLQPENPALQNNLGFSLFLHGQPREALPHLQKAAQSQPTNRRIRTNLGFVLAGTGDFSRAAREFEMGGTPAEAKNNLGFAYERQGNLGQAFDNYVQAIRMDPRAGEPRSNLRHVAATMQRHVPDDLPPLPQEPDPPVNANQAGSVKTHPPR